MHGETVPRALCGKTPLSGAASSLQCHRGQGTDVIVAATEALPGVGGLRLHSVSGRDNLKHQPDVAAGQQVSCRWTWKQVNRTAGEVSAPTASACERSSTPPWYPVPAQWPAPESFTKDAQRLRPVIAHSHCSRWRPLCLRRSPRGRPAPGP